MKKIKRLGVMIGAVIMLISTLTFMAPTSEVSAGYWGNGNGVLEYGEFYDVTPSVYVGAFDGIKWEAFQNGNRPINFKIVKYEGTRIVAEDDYLWSYHTKKWGTLPYNYLKAGKYRMELRCTTGSTPFTDCWGSAKFKTY